MHLLFLCFSVLTLTENDGERVRDSGQEPIVQVSLRDLPLIFYRWFYLEKGRSHLYIFQMATFSAFDKPSFLVYSRYTHMRAYQN